MDRLKQPPVPQFLTQACVEFFNIGDVKHKSSKGVTIPISELPGQFLQLLKERLAGDSKANRGLDKLGIKDPAARIDKFYECNYSAYDGNPDLSACGTVLGTPEYVPCKFRDTCKAQGLLCKIPGDLTPRQVKILKRIAHGEGDDQICMEMFISQSTLRSHKNSIETKIGYKGKILMAVWAIHNRII